MVGDVNSGSPLIERWVRRLTPPACREEVLGDLAERCASPREYLHDAVRTLPFVIASRLRRTTNPVYVLMVGLFLWWASFYGSFQAHWLVATIPTVLILAVLALRDAWRLPTLERQARTVALDVTLVATTVLLSQGILWWRAPALLLNRPALLVGFPLGLGILYFLRLQSPTGVLLAGRLAPQLSLGQIRGEIALRDTVIRRAVTIELGACVAVSAIFAAIMLWSPAPPIIRLGCGLTVLGAVFVAAFLWRFVRVRPIPTDLDFGETVRRYHIELERRRRLSRNYAWWYLAPLGVGTVVTIIGSQLQRPGGVRGAALSALVIGALFGLLTLLQLVEAAKTQKRMDQLALVTEKRAGESV